MESNQPEPEPFNDVEVQILNLLAAGMSLKEIEQQLHRSSGWLNENLSNKTYKKLGVNNRYDAVTEARVRGIISPPSISTREALEIGRQASKKLLYQPELSKEELDIMTRYRTLLPFMTKLAFSFRVQGQIYAEISQRARTNSPEIYGRIGLAAEAVSDKLDALGTEYEAGFGLASQED